MPSCLEMSLACGGKIDDTRTRLYWAIPAERRAISKLESFSRCFPTPWVRKIFFVTKAELIAGRLPDNGVPYKQIGRYRAVLSDGNRQWTVGSSTRLPVVMPARAA